MDSQTRFERGNEAVLELLESYPDDVKSALLDLRSLIFETADETVLAGDLQETLKWGQPSYLTVKPKSGTTIRIDRDKSDAGDYALFVNCQSSLVSEWRAMFPGLVYGGDRSVHFRLGQEFPENQVREMIIMALTYHVGKRSKP